MERSNQNSRNRGNRKFQAACVEVLEPRWLMTTEVATWSDSFVNSIGINSKGAGYGGAYTNQTAIAAALADIGIRNVRGTPIQNSTGAYLDGVVELHVTADHESAAQYKTDIDNQLASLKTQPYAANVIGFNMPNEMDYNDKVGGSLTDANGNYYYQTDIPTLAQVAATEIHNDSYFSKVPLLGPTLGKAYGYTGLGDVSSFIDAGDDHGYSSAETANTNIGMRPSVELQNMLGLSNGYSTDDAPTYITEIGYSTYQATGQNGVSATVQGRYYPRMYLEAFNAGVVKTFGFMLGDDPVDGGGTLNNWHSQLGILDSTDTYKPAATALKNLIGFLSDPNGGTPYEAGALNYMITGPSDIHHTLLQKADGTFELALWREVDSTDTLAANENVTLSFTTPVSGSATTYVPNTGVSTPVTLSGGAITLGVNDQVTILQLTPTGTRPAAPAAPSAVHVTASGAATFAAVSWSNNDSNTTGYVVERQGTDGDWNVLTRTTATSYVDHAVVPGKTYSYRVWAVDQGGGNVSVPVTYTAPTGSVLVDPLNDTSQLYSSTNFTIQSMTPATTFGKQWANDPSADVWASGLASTLVYNKPGISSFQATAYIWLSAPSTEFTAQASADGVNWTSVTLNYSDRGSFQLPQQYSALLLKPAAPLPTGTNFIKISVTSTNNVNSPQGIGQVKLWYGTNSLPDGWSDGDIGSPAMAGSASYAGGSWTVNGGGVAFSGANDNFNLASTTASGNQVMIAHIASVQNLQSTTRAGVMFRDSTASNSMFAAAFVTPTSGIRFAYRTTTGGNYTTAGPSGIAAPVWVKLVKSGNTYTGYYATTAGTPGSGDWIQIGTTTIAFSNSTYRAGLFVNASQSTGIAAATFDNVSITPTVAKLTGTVIGTAGASGSPLSNAFDGNLSTYYQSASPNGQWVGLDLGSAMTVTQIKFAPRAGASSSSMIGGSFEVSNDPTFSTFTTAYTITDTPPDGVLTVINVSVLGQYRYMRYIGPDGHFGAIAELEFDGY